METQKQTEIRILKKICNLIICCVGITLCIVGYVIVRDLQLSLWILVGIYLIGGLIAFYGFYKF